MEVVMKREIFLSRSDYEIRNMIKTLEEEHKNLPDENAFGCSNETDKEELLLWIKNLNSVLKTSTEEGLELDVALWLNKSSHSALNDYE